MGVGRLIDYDNLAHEAWTRLGCAGDDRNHSMRLVVLATVDPGGAPDARTMILRGADRQSGRIWFYTDRRSEKADHVRGCPWVCVVAYDRANGIQLRLRGAAAVHESDQAADGHWKQASLSLQVLFASAEPPGRPLVPADPRLAGIKRSVDAGRAADARANFAVIEISVRAIEWLQLFDGEQRRAALHAATGWASQPLSP